MRRCCDRQAVGAVQATVAETGDGLSAEIAGVVATAHQGRGYAREAAEAMVSWLREQGAGNIVAHIHPDHQASAAMARAVGLAPTSTLEDGELRWER